MLISDYDEYADRTTLGENLVVCYANLFFAAHNFLRLSGTFDRNRRNIGRSDACDAQLLAKFSIDAGEDFLVVLEEGANVFAALSDTLALVAVPSAALVDDVVQYREVEHVALARDAFAIKNVEFSIAEWSRDLVLDDLDFGA